MLVPPKSLERNDDVVVSDQCFSCRRQASLELLNRDGRDGVACNDERDRFLRRYTAAFLRLVRARRWRQAEFEDGVQELWLTIISRLSGFGYDEQRGLLDDWIMVTARHRVVDLERRRRARSMHQLSVAQANIVVGREEDPSIIVDRKCLQELVRDALTELKPDIEPLYFDSFVLHWYEGLSIQDISQRLGRSEAQIWSAHHRLIRKLRNVLAHRLGVEIPA